MEDRFIVQTSTPERLFVKVYLDFLNAGLLSGKEQIIFIHLKQYINFKDSNNVVRSKVYPTLATLAKNVKMSEKTVRTILKSLQKKGILEIKQQGMNKPNIYKINDSAEMWKAETVEELKIKADELEEKRMIEILTAKGYYISKEKGLEKAVPAKATADSSTLINNLSTDKNNTKGVKSQVDRYTIEAIKEMYRYEDIIIQYPDKQTDIDIVFDILYDTLNRTKPTVRINGQEKQTMVVIGKLKKLELDDLVYAVTKFHEQTDRIKNVKAYLLTILYHAKDQYYLDLMNLGHYNGDF